LKEERGIWKTQRRKEGAANAQRKRRHRVKEDEGRERTGEGKKKHREKEGRAYGRSREGRRDEECTEEEKA